MNHVITLVASSVPLTQNHFDKAASSLGVEVDSISWLEDNKAGEFGIGETVSIEAMKALRSVFDTDKIDVFCTPVENRRKKLFLADMDSTIVTSETLDELAAEAGIKDKISTITARAMRGEIDFFDAIRERVGLLDGLPIEALKRTLDATEVSQGAELALKTMRGHDVFCALVSGGFTYFTNDIAQKLGFQANHGNILGVQDNKLTGEVIDPILDKDTKLALLKKYADEQGVDLSQSAAIGDGANDLPMLEAAGLGIGYHPKPLLEERLLNCIRHTDLRSILYAQGYQKEELAL